MFEKKDGTERTMICTTNSDIINEYNPSGTNFTGRTVTVPEHQVRVFDVQKKAWRSFCTDSIISFNVAESV